MLNVMCVPSGLPLGATSSVEEIVSTMVSLEACLTGLLRRGPPRTRQGGSHNFFLTAPVQDVHVLSDVASENLRNAQSPAAC